MAKCLDGCVCGRHGQRDYPRTCRRGHTITGPEGETIRPGRRQCKACLKITQKVADAKSYAANPEKTKARLRAYRQTPAGRASARRANEKYDATSKGLLRRIRAMLGEAYREREELL